MGKKIWNCFFDQINAYPNEHKIPNNNLTDPKLLNSSVPLTYTFKYTSSMMNMIQWFKKKIMLQWYNCLVIRNKNATFIWYILKRNPQLFV